MFRTSIKIAASAICITVFAVLTCITEISAVEEETPATVSDMKIDLGEVVITARRVQSVLAEAPKSISVITEDEIRESSADNVADLLGELEGVHHYDASGAGTASRINLRGFYGGMSSHTLVLVDGIPQNGAQDKLVDWSLIPLENVEKIEISRGPESTLYGENAMGGVISITTKKGYGTRATSLETEFGSFNSRKLVLSTKGPAGKDNTYSLGFVRNETDGYREHCDYENMHFNGSFDWSTGRDSYMSTTLQYSSSDRGAYPWALTRALVDQDRTQARPGTERDEGDEKKLLFALTLHDMTDKTNIDTSLYFRNDQEESFYTSSSAGANTRESLDDENVLGGSVVVTYLPETTGAQHSIAGGIDLEKNDYDYIRYNATNLIRTTIRDNYSSKRNKVGIFVEDEISAGNRLKITVGARYDRITDRYTDSKNNTHSSKKQTSFNPRLGIVRTISRSASGEQESVLFFNIAKAFRTPTMGQLFTYSSSNLNLKPEKAVNYEIGLRHSFSSNSNLRLSLYRMNVENEIWYDSAATSYENYGKTAHTGIETAFDRKVSERLSFSINHTYTISKKKSGTDTGNYMESVPKHEGYLGLRYNNPRGWGLNLSVDGVSSAYLDSGNTAKLPGYVTMDLKFRNEWEKGDFTFGFENILDKNYYSSGYKSSGTEYLTPVPGRTFTVGMSIGL